MRALALVRHVGVVNFAHEDRVLLGLEHGGRELDAAGIRTLLIFDGHYRHLLSLFH
jgi:hypothetical protein